jgi:hypothetical protein
MRNGKCLQMNRALSSAYSAGCRCDDCVAWQQAYYRRRRADKATGRLGVAQRAREQKPEPQEAPYGTRARACQHARLVAKRLLALQKADALVLMIALDHFEDMLRLEARRAPAPDAAEADHNNEAFRKGELR